jgi:hypothetical protein
MGKIMSIRGSAALLALMLLTLSSAHALVVDEFFSQSQSQYRAGIEALENERYEEAISLGREYVNLAPKGGKRPPDSRVGVVRTGPTRGD